MWFDTAIWCSLTSLRGSGNLHMTSHMVLICTLHELQNPEVVALKEDIKRTGKKLKLWERELEDRKTKLADQHSKVAKLEQDLEQVNAGEPCLALSCMPETGLVGFRLASA